MDREISGIEKQLVEAAEAMPEDRFDFSPESLKIPGKHVAASNYFLFASVTGEKIPGDFKGGNGAARSRTRSTITAR